MNTTSAFWDDHVEDLADPEYAHAFERGSARIAAYDRLINTLDTVRKQQGLTKAEVARVSNHSAAVIRRLFTANGANPTIGLVTDVAAALGFRITLESVGTAAPATIPAADAPHVPASRRTAPERKGTSDRKGTPVGDHAAARKATTSRHRESPTVGG